MNNFFNIIQYKFSYHSKFLSIGRILISIIIIIDLIYRFQNLEPHYSEDGVLPTSVIKHYYPFYQYYFSLHNFCHTILSQKVLFILHIIAAVGLLIGYKTTLFTVLNFILLISLHHRNPLILQGGDDLLRITLFYMLFLNWGKFYSIDGLIGKNTEPARNIEFSWIFVVFQWNIAFVYLFSALLKTADEWRVSGEAIYYALSLDTLRTSAGNVLYPHFSLLKISTYIIYYGFEILVPVLLILSPTIKLRNIAAMGIILLHLFILTNLKVGIFSFVGISTAFMLFLPARRIDASFSFNKKQFYFALIIFILILRYNLATLQSNYFNITLFEDRLLNSIGLSQRWNMFSPGVKRYDGWLVLRGIKKDNSEWDLIHHTPVIHYEKTEKNFNYLKGDRWRKFLENYEQTQYNFVKPYFCYYLIKKFNAQYPNHTIEALQILFVKKTTLPHYQYKTGTENLCICNLPSDNTLK